MTVIQKKKKEIRMAMEEFVKLYKIKERYKKNNMFTILFENEICMFECKANIDTPCFSRVSFVADVEAVN